VIYLGNAVKQFINPYMKPLSTFNNNGGYTW